MLQADSITKLSKSSRNALVIIENQVSFFFFQKKVKFFFKKNLSYIKTSLKLIRKSNHHDRT